jgi:hypothetical protein
MAPFRRPATDALPMPCLQTRRQPVLARDDRALTAAPDLIDASPSSTACTPGRADRAPAPSEPRRRPSGATAEAMANPARTSRGDDRFDQVTPARGVVRMGEVTSLKLRASTAEGRLLVGHSRTSAPAVVLVSRRAGHDRVTLRNLPVAPRTMIGMDSNLRTTDRAGRGRAVGHTRRRLRGVTLTVALAGAVLTGPVGPAAASCAESGPDGSPVIFTGTVTENRRGSSRSTPVRTLPPRYGCVRGSGSRC